MPEEYSTPINQMIKGVHTMFYSSQPAELCAFIRDKLGFPFTDVGEGWLIFDLPEAEMGCHPADPVEGEPAGWFQLRVLVGGQCLGQAFAGKSEIRMTGIRGGGRQPEPGQISRLHRSRA